MFVYSRKWVEVLGVRQYTLACESRARGQEIISGQSSEGN